MLFGFWQTLSLQKSPPLPGAKNFVTWLLRRICKLERRPGRSMAVLIQCIRRRLLAISASKQVESFYRAVQRATKVTRNFPKSHVVVQIYQTDARWGGSRNAIEEMTGEKRCLTVKISYPS